MPSAAESPPAVEAPSLLVAVTTLPDRERALALARGAVEAGLAACAQVDGAPISSVYRWQGRLCEDAEWRLTFKLAPEREAALRAWIHARHPYELPQWVVLPAAATAAYAAWVGADATVTPPG